jgi:uncharacterized alpha-E superfamily protein
VLSRVAEDLFRLSRDVERAITVGRLIDVTWHLELDAGEPDEAGEQFWAPLLGFVRDADPGPLTTTAPEQIRFFLAFDLDNPNSLISCIRRARAAAHGVRESISSEMWEQLNLLHLSLVDPRMSAEAEQDPAGFYRRVREGAQLFHGLADCTLSHDEPWHFLTLGMQLERARNVARLIDLQAHLLVPSGAVRNDEAVRWLAVLRSCGAAEAYARHYAMRVEPARMVEFLLLNPTFPQSIRFCVRAARGCLDLIGESESGWEMASRTIGQLYGRIEYAAVDEIMEEGLSSYLRDVERRIERLADLLTTERMRNDIRPGRLVGVARAAQLMAAQQQQQ